MHTVKDRSDGQITMEFADETMVHDDSRENGTDSQWFGSLVSTPISLVLPMFNEAPVVDTTLKRAVEGLERKFADFEIVVADDASTDGCAEKVEQWTRKDPRIKLVRLPHNQRFGGALCAGLQAATKDFLVYTDFDLPIRLDSLPRLLGSIFGRRCADRLFRRGRQVRQLEIEGHFSRLQFHGARLVRVAAARHQFRLQGGSTVGLGKLATAFPQPVCRRRVVRTGPIPRPPRQTDPRALCATAVGRFPHPPTRCDRRHHARHGQTAPDTVTPSRANCRPPRLIVREAPGRQCRRFRARPGRQRGDRQSPHDGLLTSASLLIAAPHAAEAIEFAKVPPEPRRRPSSLPRRRSIRGAPDKIPVAGNRRRAIAPRARSLSAPDSCRIREWMRTSKPNSARRSAGSGHWPASDPFRHPPAHAPPSARAEHRHPPRARVWCLLHPRPGRAPLAGAPMLPQRLPRKVARWFDIQYARLTDKTRSARQGFRTVDRAVGVLDPGHLTEPFLASYLPLIAGRTHRILLPSRRPPGRTAVAGAARLRARRRIAGPLQPAIAPTHQRGRYPPDELPGIGRLRLILACSLLNRRPACCLLPRFYCGSLPEPFD
jgi:hypothetical protein